MTPFGRFLFALLTAILAVCPLNAADKPQLMNRLKTAASLSSLDLGGLRPWHIAMEIDLFDEDGKNPRPATVEIWAADNNVKMVESVGGVQATTVRKDGKLFRSGGQAPDFVLLELLVEQILHPIPDEVLQAGVTFKEDQLRVAKTTLECINPTIPAPAISVVYVGRQLSFCFKEHANSLIVGFAPGDLISLRNQIGIFQSKEVTIDLEVMSGKTLVSRTKVKKLETYTPQSDDFIPTGDMVAFTGPVDVKRKDLLNSTLSQTPPSYPVEAKARGISGNVNFDVIIGPDGHILSAQATGQSSPYFLTGARDAVQKWVFRPFNICGVSVPIHTIITVKFNIGS
jgi:TonB family protein